MLVARAADGVAPFLAHLAEERRTSADRPAPVRRVCIPKRSGGQRPLGIPPIRDRVVQTAVRLVLEPLCEADFQPCSYGFRPQKSAHQADGVPAGVNESIERAEGVVVAREDKLGYVVVRHRDRGNREGRRPSLDSPRTVRFRGHCRLFSALHST